jgi:hypothetical protein
VERINISWAAYETCAVLVGKHERKKQLGRFSRRWKDNINIYVIEIWCVRKEWIRLAQDVVQRRAPVDALMNHWVS